MIQRLREGARRFKREIFPKEKGLYAQLVIEGAKPSTVVIGCSDSRVEFQRLTGAEIGQLFVVRNAGNIIPPYGSAGGVGASIEYAVSKLPITDIVVCGHTHCGAMIGLMEPEKVAELPAVQGWLKHAVEARERTEKAHPDSSDDRRMRWLIGENVLLQLEHLRTYPCIKDRLGKSELGLHGWVYELETGEVWEYDWSKKAWAALEE